MATTTGAIDTASRVHRRWRLRDTPIFVLFLAPAVLFLALTSLYPLLYTLRLSFYNWFLNQPGMKPQWAGLSVYRSTIADAFFQTSAWHTVLFGVVTVPVEIVLGLALALAVAQEGRGMRIIRSILLIPMIMTPVVVGTLWRILFYDQGLIAWFFAELHLSAPLWFVSPNWAFISVMIVDIWEWTPFVLIVMVAAIAALPGEPYRAAQIDGASRWQIFRYITFPMLWPVLLITGLLRFMDAIKVFDTIYVLTGGGPGYATEMLSDYIYKQGLRYFNIGAAASSSWMFLAVVIILSLFIIRARNRLGRA